MLKPNAHYKDHPAMGKIYQALHIESKRKTEIAMFTLPSWGRGKGKEIKRESKNKRKKCQVEIKQESKKEE